MDPLTPPLTPLLTALARALLVAGPAPATDDDDWSDLDPPGATSPAPAGATLHGGLNLSLIEAIQMGLENNLDIAVERFTPFSAREDARAAWGAYDPEWFSEMNYTHNETPLSNQIETAGGATSSPKYNKVKSFGGDGGLRGMIPLLNTEYRVSMGSRRTTNDLFLESLSPRYDSDWEARISQPLLRDLIWSESWARITTTRIRYGISQEDFTRQVMDTVRAIEDGYWTLIATGEQQRVAQKSLETANALLDQTQTQYDVGVVSKVEVVEAEAGVAQRDFNLIVAENAYRNAQDVLINLVLGPGLTPDSTLEILPTDKPSDYVPYDIDREAAVRTAFEHRPELVIAAQAIEERRVDLKFRKNQRLPSLDAVASFGNNGRTGKLNPDCVAFTGGACSPPALLGDWGNSFDGWLAHPKDFAAGGVLSIPIGNVAARHRVSQGELELRKAITSKRRLEQSIILEVRAAVRNLKSAQEGIEAAKRSRIAAAEQLRSARIRLEYGESTPFDVLLREQDFVTAESDEIDALRVYRTSATALDRSQGTILRSHNIQIDQVGALR